MNPDKIIKDWSKRSVESLSIPDEMPTEDQGMEAQRKVECRVCGHTMTVPKNYHYNVMCQKCPAGRNGFGNLMTPVKDTK